MTNTERLLQITAEMEARVCVRHERYMKGGKPPSATFTIANLRALGLDPDPRGGYTCVLLVDEREQLEPMLGIATCSVEDNFNKKIGLEIALGRAIKKAQATYGERAGREESKDFFGDPIEVIVLGFGEPQWIYPTLEDSFVQYPEAQAAAEHFLSTPYEKTRTEFDVRPPFPGYDDEDDGA